MHNFCHALKLNLREPTLSKCKQLFDEQVAGTKDDYKFSTGKDPSLLLRRFVFRKVERATGDQPQGTMGRVQTSRPLSPSRLPLCARERRLDTRQKGSSV